MTFVIDASAVIALLRDEPGAAAVERALERSGGARPAAAYLSTVNLTEVLQAEPGNHRLIDGSDDVIVTVAYDAEQARAAAALLAATRHAGLGLADRACLALAQLMSLPALTADRAWAKVEVGVDVVLIR